VYTGSTDPGDLSIWRATRFIVGESQRESIKRDSNHTQKVDQTSQNDCMDIGGLLRLQKFSQSFERRVIRTTVVTSMREEGPGRATKAKNMTAVVMRTVMRTAMKKGKMKRMKILVKVLRSY
jgi:hypothetical protein